MPIRESMKTAHVRRARGAASCSPLVLSLVLAGACSSPGAEPRTSAPLPALAPDDDDAHAEAEREEPQEGGLPPLVPRPEFMRARPELPELLLEDKRAGRYFTGFPAIGYDDEKGAQLGAAVQWYDNGARDDAFFRSTPYRKSIAAGVVGGDENSELRLGFDHPYIFESPYRLRIAGTWRRSDVSRYFGVGDQGLDPLAFPGAPGESFEEYADYKEALEQVEDGLTYAKYDEYRSSDVRTGLHVERDTLGGIVRFLTGIEVRKFEVDDYTGDTVNGLDADGNSVPATEAPTHLLEDFEAGRISGFDGGWDNYFKLGATVDTRDFEPDPSSGVLGQLTTELSTPLLGSDFEYQRVTSSLAGYYSPIPEATRLVLAGRALYTTQFGEVPFFAMNSLAFNTNDEIGLGGFRSLRGYKSNRFVGDSAALLNSELRWSFAELEVFSQHLRLGVDTFYDTGRSFEGTALDLDDWRAGYGFGFFLAWNLATIIRFDSAYSDEDRIVYLELGHAF